MLTPCYKCKSVFFSFKKLSFSIDPLFKSYCVFSIIKQSSKNYVGNQFVNVFYLCR